MISLYDLLEASQGQLFGEPAARLFNGFCIDARIAQESQLYVALTDSADSLAGMAEAVQHGASGLLCTRPPDFDTEGLSVIIVKDPLDALMRWSHFVLGKLGTQVIGVAGAVNRGVVVEALRHILGAHYPVIAGSGDGGRIGIPLALAQLTPDTRIAILELDATAAGEMAAMVQAVRPHVGVVTGIGAFMGDGFPSPEALAGEIGLLLDYLSPGGLAVLDYDDDLSRGLAIRTRAQVISVGIEELGADVLAYNIVLGSLRTGFDLRYGDQRYVGRWTPLVGKSQLAALLAALAVSNYYGVPFAESLRTITDVQPRAGHMRPLIGLNGAVILDDTHDSDPASILALLDWLGAVKEKGRAALVLGDLDRLGGSGARAYRLIGQRAAEIADLFVTEGTDAALAGRSALDAGMPPAQVNITYSAHDAASRVRALNLTERDLVVVCGGASARMELVVHELLPREEDRRLLPRADRLVESVALTRPLRPTWIEIDQAALAGNVRALKAHIGPEVALFAVIKADAYGHGAIETARTALLNGADVLAVANMEEALDLREAGISAPILVMGYTPPQAVRHAVRNEIAITLYDVELARAYDRLARESGGILKAHLKVDTGMGRLGVLPGDALPLFRTLLDLKQIAVEGVYTHFSMADEDPEFTAEQLATFKRIIAPIRASGYPIRYIHAANSAATLASRENHLNAVRVGLALYGLHPSEQVPLLDGMQPVMAWRSVIAQIKTLPSDHPIGYGGTYRTSGEERVAVVPVGYADGLRRAPQHQGRVIVRGQYAPILGRVSMEKTVISVQHIPDATVGDEVTLIGRQGDAIITAEDVARQIGTINYEVVCAALARVPCR